MIIPCCRQFGAIKTSKNKKNEIIILGNTTWSNYKSYHLKYNIQGWRGQY